MARLVGYAWFVGVVALDVHQESVVFLEKKYLGILNEKASPRWCQNTTKIVSTKQF